MILKLLLVRACMCIWMIYALKCGTSSPSDQEAELLLLLTLCVSIILGIILVDSLLRTMGSRSFLFCRTIFLITFSILTIHSYGVNTYNIQRQDSYNILEELYLYIYISDYYQYLCWEISPLFSFFIAVYRHYQWKKKILFVIYLFINVICMLFMINALLSYNMVNIYAHTLEQDEFYIQHFHSDPYPTGRCSPIIRDNEHDTPSNVYSYVFSYKTSNFNHHEEKCFSNECIWYGENSRLPFKSGIFRYLGEDVHLECIYAVNRNSPPDDPIWRRNGKTTIFNTARIQVVHNKTFLVECNTYKVHSSLTIQGLRPTDFGEYTCIPEVQHEDFVIAVYEVTYIDTSSSVTYLATGRLLILSKNIFMHGRNAESAEDIHATYTINNQPLHDVCPGTDLASLLAAFNLRNTILPQISSHPDMFFKHGVRISVNVKFSLCSGGFGVHRLKFIRRLYLFNNKSSIVEVEHPHVDVILPESMPSLFRFFQDDRHLYAKIEEMVKNRENPEEIEREFIHVSPYITSNEFKVFSIANMIQCALHGLNFVITYFVTVIVVYGYCLVFIRLSLNAVFTDDMLEDSYERLALDDNLFDVFVSHAEDEREIVNEILLPFLENDCTRRCSSERDITAGMPLFPTYNSYIKNSNKIIIILSEGYLEDRHCFNLQLEHIIIPLLWERETGPHVNYILVILYGDTVELPDILKHSEHVKSVRWTNEAPTDKDLKLIKNWLFGSKYAVCSIS